MSTQLEWCPDSKDLSVCTEILCQDGSVNATETKNAQRDQVAQEAAKETIAVEKEIESDEDQVSQDKIQEIAKENADEDKKQFEYEKKRMMQKKEAEDKLVQEQQKFKQQQEDLKKASFEEVSSVGYSAIDMCAGKA